MQRMRRARTAAAICAALLAPSVAGSAGLFGATPNQDIDFARKLVQRGWAVVADRVVERGLASTNPADGEIFRIIRVDLLVRAAATTAGAAAREEAFKKAEAGLDELLKDVKSSGAAASDLGEFLLSGCSVLATEAGRVTDASRAGELRGRAKRMVELAEKVFYELREKARSAPASGNAGGEERGDEESGSLEASSEEMAAAYSFARVFYEHGRILEKAEKTAMIQRSIRELEDFQATYPGTPLSYQAAILAGQCYNELEDYRRAADAFGGVKNLLEFFKREDGQVIVDNPVAADILQRGYYLKAQASNRCQRFNDARAAGEEALTLFPAIKRLSIGLAIQVEGALALIKLGRAAEGVKILREVSKADPAGRAGEQARELLTRFSGAGGGGEDAEAIVSGFLERGEISGAIRACRQILSHMGAADPRSVPILLLLGKSYARAKRQLEAAIAFEEIMERFPDHQLASQATFEAVRSRLLADVAASSKFQQAKYQANLNRLTTKYKGSKESGLGILLQADGAFDKHDFEKAAQLYLQVPESAGEYRDNAHFQSGLAHWNLGIRAKGLKAGKPNFAKAEEVFLKVVEAAAKEDPALGAERLRNRKKLRIAARVRLADMYSMGALLPERGHTDALKVIEAAREDETDAEQEGLLNQSRVRTLAALDRLADAVQAFRALKTKFPESRILPQLSHDLALAYDRQARKAAEKNAPKDGRKNGSENGPKNGPKNGAANGQRNGAASNEEYRAHLSTALEFYAEWHNESRRLKVPVQPKTLEKTSERALAISLELTGLEEGKDSFTDAFGRTDIPKEAWDRAVRLLEEAQPKKGSEVKWELLARLGRAYGFAGNWPKARASLDEALVRGGLLTAIGEAKPAPKVEALEKNPDLLDIFIDLGYAEMIPAKKGGFGRARAIFEAAFPLSTVRDSAPSWKCRYASFAIQAKEGNYDAVDGILKNMKQAFPDWDGNRFGLKGAFEALEKEVAAKLPGTK